MIELTAVTAKLAIARPEIGILAISGWALVSLGNQQLLTTPILLTEEV
jgi:hypothetical protein